MQESISRGEQIQFQTFDTSLYGTAHPSDSVCNHWMKIRFLENLNTYWFDLTSDYR